MNDPIRQAVKEVLLGRLPTASSWLTGVTNLQRDLTQLIEHCITAATRMNDIDGTKDDLSAAIINAFGVLKRRYSSSQIEKEKLGDIYIQGAKDVKGLTSAGHVNHVSAWILEGAIDIAKKAKAIGATLEDTLHLVDVVADEVGLS